MSNPTFSSWLGRCQQFLLSLGGAVAFYTCLPLPVSWTLEFRGIARFAPGVGLLIGGVLSGLDWGLEYLGIPIFTRSVLLVIGWIGITGGLHLDGAMDTADGLAVQDPDRRLTVMTDSVTGAFGVMAALSLILLKTAALCDLQGYRWLILMGVPGWGRWGQLVAIWRYPYLKPTGKGAFHQEFINKFTDILPGLFLLLIWGGFSLIFTEGKELMVLGMGLGGMTLGILIPAWFNRKLGGHTGDTYGAVVEWTEALLLCFLVGF